MFPAGPNHLFSTSFMTLQKLPLRVDYGDAVYKVLTDAITDGSLAPGTRITQEQIAEQLEVSRSPVLQALRLLKKDGLVEDAPGRGVQVTQLSPEGIVKIYEVRGALDALAARLAAAKGHKIDRAMIKEGRRVSAGTDVKSMIDADLSFHTALYRASGNELIAGSATLHWVHLRRVMGAVLQASGQRKNIWDEHEAIADAIGAGDGARAAALAEQHVMRACEHHHREAGSGARQHRSRVAERLGDHRMITDGAGRARPGTTLG